MKKTIVSLVLLSLISVLFLHFLREEQPAHKPYAHELLQRLFPTDRKFLTGLCKELLYTSTFG